MASSTRGPDLLSRLPQDVLLMIADNLWRSDLSAFTLTCKKFHHMCKESLLEFIIIDDAEQARKIVKDNKSKIEAMNFTETVSIEKKTLYQVDTGELEFSIKMREAPCPSMAGCTQEFCEGRYFDIAGIKTVFVRRVAEEHPESPQRFSFVPFTALTSLSVVTHAGGGPIWRHLLDSQYLPVLKRLTFLDVTESIQSDFLLLPSTSTLNPIGPALDYTEVDVTEEILENTNILSQLDLLVCAPYDFLQDQTSPLPRHVAVLSHPRQVPSQPAEYVLIYLGRHVTSDNAIRSVMLKLGENAVDTSLVHLTLPTWYKQLPDGYQDVTKDLFKDKIIEYDGDIYEEVVPKSIVDYLEGQGLISRLEG